MSQAAGLFSALGDQKSAIVCLQKAIYANPQPAAELWARLASLQCETGDVDAALEAVQTALEIRPFDAGLHYLHGDLLTSQNKKQAALSCFEQSLDLLEKNPGSAWVYQAEDLLPEPLNLRIAGLLRGLGDLRTALTRAQNVVAANPKSVEGRILAADLAAGLLENPLALELASISQAKGADPDASDQISAIDIDRPSLVKLLCLQAEMHMENADDLNAADALVHASDLAPEDPRVLADQARLDARKGDFLDGMEALEAALAYLHADQPADDPTLAIAEAALELHQWQTALPLYAQVVRVAPDEARPHFCLARAYVRAKEYQPAYHSLGALRHTASLAQDPEGDFLAFEREIQSAESLSTSPEINRWYQRGITAFKGGRAEAEAKAIFGADDEVGGEPQSEPTLEGESAPKRMPEQLDRLFQHGLIQKDAAPEMAMATAQALVSQKPGHPLYEALFASVARKNHDPALAYSAIQSALNTWQDEPLWHVFAAETAEECSAPSEALEHWKAACALEPENASFTCSLGEAYLKAGNAEKAVQTLEQAATMDPSEPSAWVSLAHAYRVRRNYPEAIGAAEKAIRLAPGDVLPLAVSGNIALEAKQFELGRQRAQEILAIDENNPKAVLLLAKAEAHQGRPAQALEVIENALPTMAEPFEVLLERGKLIHKLHGAGPALEAFHSLAQRYPDQPEALAEYAMALAEAGQKDAAEHTAQSALQIKPEQADLHLLLGRIQHTAGQLDQAVFHLSEAVHLAPENVETYLELGKTYADRREHSQALQVYQQAFAIAPDDYRPYYQAGLSLKESKDYVMAETMLRRAAELAPDDLNVRRQLAAIIAINLVHNPQEAPTIK